MQAADPSEFFLHGIIFLGFVGALFWARKRTRPFVEKEPELERAVTIFNFRSPTALILTILLSGWLYPQAPRLLSSILGAAALIPVVILLRQLLEKPLFPILNTLVIFYFVDRLREVFSALPFFARFISGGNGGRNNFSPLVPTLESLSSKVEAQHFRIFTSIRKTIPFVLALFAPPSRGYLRLCQSFQCDRQRHFGQRVYGSDFIYRRADHRKSSALCLSSCVRWFLCKWSENTASFSARKSSPF